MFKSICLALLILSSGFNRDASSVEKINSVAVVPFQVLGKVENSKIYSHGLPDAISHRLSKFNNLKVLERIKLSEILQEIKLHECGLTSDDGVSKIGKMMGADVIITATIHKLSSNVRFHIRGIRISSGEIIFSILEYFSIDEFYDFSVLEYTISVDILKAIRPEYSVEPETVISRGSVESFQKYSEGLYYFDQGRNDKSKQCFQISAEINTSDYWIRKVRKKSEKMFKELDQKY
ncbi:MAG: FlgO family outer membrane protein [bacterium]